MTDIDMQWAQLARLFSVVIGVDAAGRIMHASDSPRSHLPELSVGAGFFELFTVLRPAGISDVDGLRRKEDSLFLIKDVRSRFAARGQFVEIRSLGSPVLCFCGSPWLFWMNANCPEVKLGLRDFSPQDSQLDQLFLMTTEQRMVSDLEKLNAELKSAKRETEEAQRTKDALFARMSHEMRTPLNGVVSALSLLADEALNDDARKLVTLAQSASRNLLHVINYVLDISRIEAGDARLEPMTFDLGGLLKAVTDIVRARAVEKGIDLQWRVSPQLARYYIADRAKIRQCLLNLVTNAIRFTPHGGVTISALPLRRY